MLKKRFLLCNKFNETATLKSLTFNIFGTLQFFEKKKKKKS